MSLILRIQLSLLPLLVLHGKFSTHIVPFYLNIICSCYRPAVFGAKNLILSMTEDVIIVNTMAISFVVYHLLCIKFYVLLTNKDTSVLIQLKHTILYTLSNGTVS